MVEKTVESPYIGLLPFDESDAEYFFGRDNDIEVVATNLRAARLTIFYGASGVGKSSVIRAGVVPHLQKLTKLTTLPDEPPDFLLVVLRDWASNPIDRLRLVIQEVIEKALADKTIPDLTQTAIDETARINQNNRNLTEVLKNWTDLIGTKLLIILDQFEDFFLHPEYFTGEGSFGKEFPKAINDTTLPVNFILSLRDDAISKLDFFKGKIQDPMKNTLRLRHLDRTLAEEAIRKPLEKYNEQMNTGFTIEDDLVKQILDDVQVGKIKFGTQGQADVKQFESPSSESPAVSGSYQVETPYLQLVMKRLWDYDITQREKRLAKDTLVNEKKLGGVQKIVETHLDEVMNRFNDTDKQLAAEFIHFTVTRSGAKITSDAANLADWAKLPERKSDIDRILSNLSTGDTRIYKIVVNVNDPNTNYYEVAHDALAPAILNWRSRYVAENNRLLAQNNLRKTRVKFLLIFGIAIVLITAIVFGLQKIRDEKKKDEDAREVQTLREIEIKNLTNILYALTNLADKSEQKRIEAIKQFQELVDNGQIPSELESQLIKLVKEIGNGNEESKKISMALKPPNPNPNPTPTPTPKPTPSTVTDEDITPRVYIQILNEDQRNPAKKIEGKLESSTQFIVPGIQNVGERSLKGTQVRYFRKRDETEAGQVVDILKQAGIKNAAILYIPGFEDSTTMRPKHLELWFAADAFDNDVNTIKK